MSFFYRRDREGDFTMTTKKIIGCTFINTGSVCWKICKNWKGGFNRTILLNFSLNLFLFRMNWISTCTMMFILFKWSWISILTFMTTNWSWCFALALKYNNKIYPFELKNISRTGWRVPFSLKENYFISIKIQNLKHTDDHMKELYRVHNLDLCCNYHQ